MKKRARKKESRREHNAVVASTREAAEIARKLAPPEERIGQGSNNGGAIVVDTADLKLPSDFTEREENESRLFGLEPVAVIILLFALAFIVFIAYLISTEPPKGKEEPGSAIEKQQ